VKDVITSKSACSWGNFCSLGTIRSMKIKHLAVGPAFLNRAETSAGSANRARKSCFPQCETSWQKPSLVAIVFSPRSGSGVACSRTCTHLARMQKTNDLPRPGWMTGGHPVALASEAENATFSAESGNSPLAWQCACYEFWEKSKISLGYAVIRTRQGVPSQVTSMTDCLNRA
jgi:hypothetical protein